MCRRAIFVALLAVAGLTLAGPSAGHRVDHEHATQGDDVVVTLRYADGTPFVAASCEVRVEGEDDPFLVGQTDDEGRFRFVPAGPGPFVVRAFGEDGHGAVLRIDGEHDAEAIVAHASPGSGLVRVGAGVLIILALFLVLARLPGRLSRG